MTDDVRKEPSTSQNPTASEKTSDQGSVVADLPEAEALYAQLLAVVIPHLAHPWIAMGELTYCGPCETLLYKGCPLGMSERPTVGAEIIKRALDHPEIS